MVVRHLPDGRSTLARWYFDDLISQQQNNKAESWNVLINYILIVQATCGDANNWDLGKNFAVE